ncbi:MAG TPA: ATP-binding protein [Bacillota bacterium]|nr:ATP-binding protein [Bacillota bacterium]HQD77162.1 ATP-binding protein [Bacillota bacterium]HUM58323.1 ATP-binding protein [Bacillota bacterium]
MAIQFHRAERKKAKLRLALAGPAGSGKTYSSLLIAFGLGGRVALIDTERGSGELYAHLGEYDVCSIEAPFTPEKYIEAIRAAEGAGYDTIIIDSLSHAWAGPGGVLDIHGHAADKSGNSWTAWRLVTPRHNDLVDAMLLSKCHIIATMRSKMDHVQTVENGKTVVKKVGMNPIQRDGMEYEFTVFMDLDQTHTATASKDRTSLFDGQVIKPTPETGQILKEWLESGVDLAPAALVQKTERPQAPAPGGNGEIKSGNGKSRSTNQSINNIPSPDWPGEPPAWIEKTAGARQMAGSNGNGKGSASGSVRRRLF